MKKVKAIIERAGDGSYSVYMDADDISYLITGTGKNAEEAINYSKKLSSYTNMIWLHSFPITARHFLWLDCPE